MDTSDLQPSEAAQRLSDAERIRARVEQRTDYRAYGWIQAWSGVVLAAYVGMFLATQAAPPTGVPFPALILPVLLYSALVQGALGRLRVRTQPRAWLLCLTGASILVPFSVLAGLRVAGIAYPWWLGLLTAAAVLVLLSGNGVRLIRRAAREPAVELWRNRALTTTARVTTIAVALYLGAVGGTGMLPALGSQTWLRVVSAVATLLLTLLLLVYLVGWHSPWGLVRVGSEWGPLHWLGFGVTLALLFALVVLVSFASWMTMALAIGGGVLITLPLAVTAFIPVNRDRD